MEEQDEDPEKRLQVKDIGIKKFKINHGLNNGHPLNHVKFFSKNSEGAYMLKPFKLESMTPKNN